MNNAKLDFKSANHHWWPQSLSSFWKNDMELVYRIDSDEKETQSNPKNFGSLKNAHHIKFNIFDGVFPEGGNINFESIYCMADSNLPVAVKSLSKNAPVSLDEMSYAACIECIISLFTRNPRFRDSIKKLIANVHTGSEDELRDREAYDVGIIQTSSRDFFFGMLNKYGVIAIIHAPEGTEFIVGDGNYHNLSSAHTPQDRPRILLPMTPTECWYYFVPQIGNVQHNIISLRCSNEDVTFCNETVQLYSKNEIFYRSVRPALTDNFRMSMFCEYENHEHNWFDELERRLLE